MNKNMNQKLKALESEAYEILRKIRMQISEKDEDSNENTLEFYLTIKELSKEADQLLSEAVETTDLDIAELQ